MKKMFLMYSTLLYAFAAALPVYGASHGDHGEAHNDHGPEITHAIAVLHPTEGNEARGVVRFTKVDEGIEIVAELTGLAANGLRGFHVHQYGDCHAPDGTSAGGHFNPLDHLHAGPEEEQRHVGDLGNIEVDAEGNATYRRVDKHLSFKGKTSIIGRSVIVHAETDDLETQPTGDAGPRVACGVIGIAQGE
ncbi:MAG: superoxide dismutase family protein [Opitutales bacterium]